MFMAGLMAQRTPPPTGITFVGASSTYAVSTSSISCSMPSGVASGDLVLCLFFAPKLTDSDIVCSTSGFTELVDQYIEANDTFFGSQLGIFSSVISGTPPSSVSVTGITPQAENHIQLLAFRGMSATTPVGSFIGSLTRNNQCASTVANNTATLPANSMLVMVNSSASFYGTGTVAAAQTAPSGGPTLAASRQSNYSGRHGALTSAYWLRAASGSFNAGLEGIGTFGNVYNSGTSRSSIARTLAILPP